MENLQGEDCELTLAVPKTPKPSKGNGKDTASKMKKILPGSKSNAAPTSVHGMLAKLHKPQPGASLESLWRAVVIEVDGGFVAPFTLKQRGQLKQIAAKCPEGEARAVIEWALRHWLRFTATAKSDADAFKMPLRPEVGFLLRYVGVAASLWLKEAHKPQFVPVRSIASKPPKPVEPAPATKEEMLDIFYGPDD
jgi:hypothetical protein